MKNFNRDNRNQVISTSQVDILNSITFLSRCFAALFDEILCTSVYSILLLKLSATLL